MSFIGDKKVKSAITSKDKSTVEVSFKHEEPTITLNKKLYDQIISEKQGRGNVTDAINHLLATKFILELSELGLNFNMIEAVSAAMNVLAYNLREDLIRKTFDCTGANDIQLNKIVK